MALWPAICRTHICGWSAGMVEAYASSVPSRDMAGNHAFGTMMRGASEATLPDVLAQCMFARMISNTSVAIAAMVMDVIRLECDSVFARSDVETAGTC